MKRLLALIISAFVFAFASPAQAQEKFPSKPIKVITAYGPGSATDIEDRWEPVHRCLPARYCASGSASTGANPVDNLEMWCHRRISLIDQIHDCTKFFERSSF